MWVLNYYAYTLLVQLHHYGHQDLNNYDCPQGKDKPGDLQGKKTALVHF